MLDELYNTISANKQEGETLAAAANGSYVESDRTAQAENSALADEAIKNGFPVTKVAQGQTGNPQPKPKQRRKAARPAKTNGSGSPQQTTTNSESNGSVVEGWRPDPPTEAETELLRRLGITKQEGETVAEAAFRQGKGDALVDLVEVSREAEEDEEEEERKTNGSGSPQQTTTSKAEPTSAAVVKPAVIPYEEAVSEGKEIINKIEASQDRKMRLGELADRIQPLYKDKTLAKFAKAIGIAPCTLARCRSVYRAWYGEDAAAYEARTGKKAPAPESYSVAQELQTLPDRFEIIEENPTITKYFARGKRLKRKQKQQSGGLDGETGEWRPGIDDFERHAQRWWKTVLKLVTEIESDDGLAKRIENETVLADARVIIKDLKALAALRTETDRLALPSIRAAGERLMATGEGLIKVADFLEKVHAPPAAQLELDLFQAD
jgi:hypothetical protein